MDKLLALLGILFVLGFLVAMAVDLNAFHLTAEEELRCMSYERSWSGCEAGQEAR